MEAKNYIYKQPHQSQHTSSLFLDFLAWLFPVHVPSPWSKKATDDRHFVFPLKTKRLIHSWSCFHASYFFYLKSRDISTPE